MRRRDHVLLLGATILICGCREELIHDLDEHSANRVQLALLQSGLDAEKTRSGDAWSISVNAEELTSALTVLEASRVLRREMVRPPESTPSLLMSREEREQALLRASALLLERTLEGLPEVLEARVHVRALNSGERGSLTAGSASVVVVAASGSAGAVDEIRAIAVGALGVAPERLNVLLRIEPQRAHVQERGTAKKSSSLPLWWSSLTGIATLIAAIIGVGAICARRASGVTRATAERVVPSGGAKNDPWSRMELEADAF